MASLRAHLLFNILMPLLQLKRRYAPPVSAAALQQRRPSPAAAPRDAVATTFRGQPIYRLRPATSWQTPALLYLHGGGFINPITRHHWRLIRQLVRDTGAPCDVPLYPLAPEHSLEEMLDYAYALWTRPGYTSRRVIVADSAGALLALRLTQQLRDENAPLPVALMLICPCLDLTFSDPLSQQLDAVDPMLSATGLPDVGRIAAGALEPTDALISPLANSMAGLPPMLVFSAGRDVLAPDAQRLITAVQEAGGQVESLHRADMVHVWPLLPIPEAKAARQRIAAFVAGAGKTDLV